MTELDRVQRCSSKNRESDERLKTTSQTRDPTGYDADVARPVLPRQAHEEASGGEAPESVENEAQPE
jgi:hypothetical protein